MDQYSFKISENLDGIRLDKAVTILSDFTRSRIQQLIKERVVFLNGIIVEDCSKYVHLGDEIRFSVPAPRDSAMLPADIELDVIYEDNDLLVINKQAGLTVHPGAGQHDDTLANALLKHCGDSLSGIGGVTRPGIVHRLDRDTSGLMVVAKNDLSHTNLAKQIENRELKRIYKAILWGVPTPHEGTITTNIARNIRERTKMQVVQNGGKFAKTHYKVLEILDGKLSLVECRLDTGRTHQIRVHMTHIGHSIIGDQTYGSNNRKISNNYKGDIADKLKSFGRQALHSCYIEFTHPTSNKVLSFSSDLPQDMQELIGYIKFQE
ncbi:MAG: RluA family pseudouridine synthase [Rickettsiaceae bacterium]|nr:RluA family pseudouridine synthase [Rickettsiaceae bacterium]